MMRILFLSFALFISLHLNGQRIFSLQECIQIAQKQSPEAEQARYNYQDAYYRYKIYKNGLLPNLSFSGTLPNLNRTISKITLPDGSEAFVSQSTGNYTGSLSLTQPIPWTGGSIFVSSALQRLDVYGENGTISYLANPINIGLSQSLFGYNNYKWQKKIEPAQLRKAEKNYIELLEGIALQTIELYFELLKVQTNIALKQSNMLNNDTLLFIAEESYKAGKITEDELLQIRINNLNLSLEIEDLFNQLNEQQQKLKDFLKLEDNEYISLEEPVFEQSRQLNKEYVLQKARENSIIYDDNSIRLLEAQSNLAKIKSEQGFSFDIYATFGLSNSAENIDAAYKNPLNQEQVTLSINIPILNWNVNKYKRKRAEIALQKALITNHQDETAFCQDINSAVNRFNIQQGQREIVKKAVELSEARFELSKIRYVSGKLSFLEYSVAQNEKDNARLEYIQSIYKSWTNYFEIRKLTLFDFAIDQEIKVSE